MIHLETIQRADSIQTAPQVCMHCEDPDLRARVPGRRDQEDTPMASCRALSSPGASAARTACLPARSGSRKYHADIDQMMKCDLCYMTAPAWARNSSATVCPSQVLAFTTRRDRTHPGTHAEERVDLRARAGADQGLRHGSTRGRPRRCGAREASTRAGRPLG